MKIKIKVTQEILEESKMCGIHNVIPASQNCAIALAVREIFGEDCSVGNKISIYKDKELIHRISIPMEAQIFINEFDNLNPQQRVNMEPISFDIDVPNELIDQIGISQVYKILSESRTLELVNI